jgi:hypothetical protein
LRVILVERPTFIARNFEVWLENIDSGRERTVFRSPDAGRPVGSERIVWSVDGSRFLLLKVDGAVRCVCPPNVVPLDAVASLLL